MRKNVPEVRETLAPGPFFDEAAETRQSEAVTGGRATSRHSGDLCHQPLGLGLPADDKNPQAQALRPPVQVQKQQQADGIHEHDTVKIDHEDPLHHGDLVQCLLESRRGCRV